MMGLIKTPGAGYYNLFMPRRVITPLQRLQGSIFMS